MGLFSFRSSRRPAPAPASLTFTLQDAGYTYEDGTVGLQPVTLTIQEQHVAVIGLNGSGKSTLLGLLDGSLRPGCGSVQLAGGGEHLNLAVKRDRRRIDAIVGRVHREEIPGSFRASATVSDALDTLMKAGGVPEAERQALIGNLFAHFALADTARRHVDELDAEHRHLLAIVAALALSPAAIVADEPTKGLDEVSSAHVAHALFSYGHQVVFATHDTSLLTRPEYAIDRVLVLDAGHVAFDGAPRQAVAFYDDLVRRAFEAAKAQTGAQRQTADAAVTPHS